MTLPCVRIEASHHRFFTESSEDHRLFPWFNSYYEGLLGLYGLKMDHAALARGKNNDFLTMATHVMEALEADCGLSDTGLFLMAYQSLDTYYPFRSTTTRLCRQFEIEAPAIALTEQEQSSPYIALTILLAALKRDSFCGAALLLVLDQATLPYKTFQDSIDTALVMKLVAVPNGTGTAVEGSHFWIEDSATKPAWIIQRIFSYLDTHRVELSTVEVVADENLRQVLTEIVQPDKLNIADPKFMSCSGLLAVVNLLNAGSRCVLLAHLSNDGHLYLFLFRNTETNMISQ